MNVSGQYGVSATGGGANYIFGKDIDIAGAMRSDEGGEPTEGSGLQATSASHNEMTVTDGGGINISGHLGMDAASNGLNEDVYKRQARKGRNPRTGKEITIPASKVAKFTPGKGLKDAIK